jgi:hypothetical protein
MGKYYVDSDVATTPSEIRDERNKKTTQFYKKYIFSPLRFVGTILFLLLLYIFIFKV